jgi:hypothetical protein
MRGSLRRFMPRLEIFPELCTSAKKHSGKIVQAPHSARARALQAFLPLSVECPTWGSSFGWGGRRRQFPLPLVPFLSARALLPCVNLPRWESSARAYGSVR